VISIGFEKGYDAFSVGRTAAGLALEGLAPGAVPRWALVFSGGRHDPEPLLEGLRSRLGTVPVLGGSGVGIITNDFLGYSGFETVVAVFDDSLPEPGILSAGNLDQGEREAGYELGRKIREASRDGDAAVLLYDSVRHFPPPVLNVGSCLMEGIRDGMKERDVTLLGAGLVGDLQMSRSYVFDGRRVVKNTAAAVILPSRISSRSVIMHGCVPASSFMEITRIRGPVVYELDGRPALDVLCERMGIRADTGLCEDLPLVATLGQKHGDPFAPYDESRYVNRLIVTVNREDRSVTLFEADFQPGTQVQIMARDNRLMLESVRRGTRKLLDSLGSSSPVWALYIDCAGRTSAFSGSQMEEASLLQEELGSRVPLVGFYSGVEVAPLLGVSRPLDWTGVLTVFCVEEA